MFSNLSRATTAAMLPLLMVLSACQAPKSSSESAGLTVVSYGGGAYQDSHKKAFIQPFAKTTGVAVQSVTWNAEYGRLKAMVSSGKVPWDVVEVTAGQFLRGKRENLFTKLETKPSEGEFLPGTIDDYGVANGYWGTVLAYVKDQFRAKQPVTWRDFWDTRTFPGPRSLYDDPRGNLEIALLADGVPSDRLYPLDVERAFRKLSVLKPDVRVWWTDGVQPIQLLVTHSVVLSTVWNTRVYSSPDAQKAVGYSWNGAPMELDYWVIPRGSKNASIASRFIAFACKPDTVGRQTAMVGYGPVNLAALEHVSETQRAQLPTYEPNRRQTFAVDPEWWAAHEQEIKTRWLAWKEGQ